jgi:hypothetical protein
MNQAYFLLTALLFYVGLVNAQEIPFSQQDYDARRATYVEKSLQNFNENAIVFQAFKGLPVDQDVLDKIVGRVYDEGEFRFSLVQLVRVLYFSDGQYEAQLLPAIQSIPLWLTPNEKIRGYWSENLSCMWLSNAYLLRQKYGITNVPEDLDNILNHWLDLKINYGFYEFYSTVYAPYTLAGVLNLVDFVEDPVIRSKAILVAERLLKEMLLLTNDKGVIFPASGRLGRYNAPYGSSINHLIYMLTGFGEPGASASHGGGFLATSTLDVKNVVESWKSKENFTLNIGHSLQEGFAINSPLQKNDRIIFQWSSGAYFHPDVAFETATLFNDYNLWDHREFREFSIFRNVPASLAATAAQIAGSISRSSVISGQNLAIFKDKSVTLSSVQDYWKGCKGYQQTPWVANTGKLAVFTSSGDLEALPSGDSKLDGNSTLPYVQQKDNVALIMYRANKDLALFGFDKHDIILNFSEDTYDEVAIEGQWILGREEDGYVAVLRHCYDKVAEDYVCDDQDGQVWGVIVGNKDMYGSFENFRSIVAQAKHEEKWIFKLQTLEWIYYGMIDIDGKKIEHYWNGNLLSFPQNPSTGIEYLSGNEGGFNIYPNPASSQFALQFNEVVNGKAIIRIMDISGKEVHVQTTDIWDTPVMMIDGSLWARGMYTVVVETSSGTMTRKLVLN